MDLLPSPASSLAPPTPRDRCCSTDQLPLSRRASVEAWISNAIHFFDTGSGPATSRKRKYIVEDDERSHSASPRLKLSGHVRTSLTSAALHQNNRICTGQEPLSTLPQPNDSASESCDTRSQMASSRSSKLSKANTDLMLELGLRRVNFASDETDPDNWQEIQDIMMKSRSSPEPDLEKLNDIYNSFKTAGNEADARAAALNGLVRERWYTGRNNGKVKQQLDQQWIRCVHLCSVAETTPMKDPKPDQALGWTMVAFGNLEAIVKLRFHPPKEEGDGGEAKGWKSWAAPNEQIYFPVFTTEGKGKNGDFTGAMYQNLWNGAIMVNNLLKLKQMINQEDEFLGRAMVFSLECNDTIAQLSCHWATKDSDGNACYWAKDIANWTLRDRRMEQYKEARMCIANVVEHYMDKAFKEIVADLQKLARMSIPIRASAASSAASQVSEEQSPTFHKRTHSKIASDGTA